MPDEQTTSGSDQSKGEIVSAVKAEELPAISPPETKTPVTFNQQINVQQIPPSAWDGLTPAQRMELSKAILTQMDTMDDRHYKFALKRVETETTRGTIRTVCGTLIAISGFSFAAYLAMHEQTILAMTISLPLATILAIVVGNRFVGRP